MTILGDLREPEIRVRRLELDVPGDIMVDALPADDSVLAYYKSLYNSGGIDLRWTKRAKKDELVYDSDGYWKRQAESGSIFSFFLGIHDTELDEKFDLRTRAGQHKPVTGDFFPAYDEDGGLLVAFTPRS